MSNDLRKQWETATVLDQEFLNNAHDNLLNKLELVVEIEAPDGSTIYASDRNKYVGSTFYEALLTLPEVRRTIGEYLSPDLEFSTIALELSNVDGRFNNFLPEGDDFDGWIGNQVIMKLGLDDIASTYKTIFDGQVTEQKGFQRNVSTIVITARDKFDTINQAFPNQVLTLANYPNLEEDKENVLVPIIYGDWTTNVEENFASVPGIAVNGGDPTVNGDTSNATNVLCVIANHPIQSLDTTKVYLRRGEKGWLIPAADIVNVSLGTTPSTFEIQQNSGTMTAITPDTTNQVLLFGRGDEFFVQCTGKDLGVYDDNIVSQARDILETYGGVAPADFDSSWDTYRDKNSPSESAISSFKSRVWVQDSENALEYALSMLEQVRLEAFIDRNLKLKISSLHLDDFEAAPSYSVRNWDIEKSSFRPYLNERLNFNRAKALFNALPNRNLEYYQETKIYKNDAAITQAGKRISKRIEFPNLYELATVESQLSETLRLTSGYLENVDVTLTWRSMLLDIGDFVRINVKIQSTVFNDVPAVVRDIGVNPNGMKFPVRLWSFQMIPFSGWSPTHPGITGGSTATIDAET